MTLRTNVLEVAARSGKKFDRISHGAVNAIEPAIQDQVQEIRLRAPKRTGAFARSISLEPTKTGYRIGSTSKRGFIWRFYEYGTVKQAPRPFVRPVLRNMRKTTIRVATLLRDLAQKA